MPTTRMIDIVQDGGQPARFDPQNLSAAPGDLINWRNNTSEAHWPGPKNGPRDAWMDAEIPGKLPDQPAPTSQQTLSFSAAMTNPVQYICALHPDMTGTITVS
jgi:plastocyanin